jgi:hypothetical protein
MTLRTPVIVTVDIQILTTTGATIVIVDNNSQVPAITPETEYTFISMRVILMRYLLPSFYTYQR